MKHREPQRLTIGTELGIYRIDALIGRGGMGEVYRARDSRLGRDVAIKVLPEGWLDSPDHRARFDREARALATLNHPHIGAIYGLADTDTVHGLVLELVDGQTLEARLREAHGGLPLDEVLSIARQIALALDAAHESGIVHRDLKPANVKITTAGVVKVLDFGVAKLRDEGAATPDDGRTVTLSGTHDGAIVGTIAYMSPEQARGKPVDKRADLWAFGCVLYEMLTGRRPFRGETVSDTIAATLDQTPDWSALPHSTPASVRRLLVRCLEKDPKSRLRDIGDTQFELDDALREMRPAPAPTPARRTHVGRRPLVVFAAALLVIGGLGLTWFWGGSEVSVPPVGPLTLTTYGGDERTPSLSPDGKQVAFSWNGLNRKNYDIYVLIVGSTTQPLRVTSDPAVEQFPAWSPDGTQIAFARVEAGRSAIYTVSPLGGPEHKITDIAMVPTAAAAPPFSWSPDGKSLVISRGAVDGQESGIFLTAADGSGAKRLIPSRDDAQGFMFPVMSPRGDALAYGVCPTGRGCVIAVQPLDSSLAPIGPPKELTANPSLLLGLAWTPDGASLVYGQGQGLTPFNPSFLWRVPVAGGSQPVRLDLAGNGSFPTLSAAGHRLAFSRRQGAADIWMLNQGTEPTVFPASSSFSDYGASLSSDGKRVAFTTDRSGGTNQIWLANIDGTAQQPLAKGAHQPTDQGSPRWSPDNKSIAFDGRGDDGRRHVYVIDAAGGQARVIANAPSSDDRPSWSADGKWIYFTSNRTGQNQIHRTLVAGGNVEQLTQNGGAAPMESADGTTVYYFRFTGEARTLFALPLGGAERRIDRVLSWNYWVSEKGLYYMRPSAPGTAHPYELQLLDAATKKSQTIIRIQVEGLSSGLSVSPDGRTVLASGIKEADSDLWLIENYR